jgi:hypothetical protein
MFKKIKNFICKLFNIKACQCDDEPIVIKEEIKKIIHPCPIHRYFKRKCPMCVEYATTQ